MNHFTRDTILVISPSAGGKTKTLNIIREWFLDAHIPHIFKPHSDSHTILERMYADDNEGGKHHYHPWCKGVTEGHSHTNGEPMIPFTLAGNKIAHGMMLDFFSELALLPASGDIRFAEWSGGKNINDPSEPASRADLSFTTIGEMLRKGQLPSAGLNRVLAVLHPSTDDELRQKLNSGRHTPSEEEIVLGTASWQLDDTAMKIFGTDDFDVLIPLFNERGIPHIHTIQNDGRDSLIEGLELVVPGILLTWSETWHGREGTAFRRKEY